MEQIEFTVNNSGIEEKVFFPRQTVEEVYLPLLKQLTRMQQEKDSRLLVLLAAPPGCGKTVTSAFLQHLSQTTPGLTPLTVIGMDGFHHYQDYLLAHTIERDGRQINMVQVKGAPETFDLPLLTARLKRVAAGENCGWPTYDRTTHNPRENAIQVQGPIVLLEGNYLLLDREGWRDLKTYADYTIAMREDEDLLRRRLISRKISTGVTPEAAATFVDFSDLHNVRTCLQETMPADLEM